MWWSKSVPNCNPTDTQSWGWYSDTPWPNGFLGALDVAEGPRGQGLKIDAGKSFTEVTWHDADRDGKIEEKNVSILGDTTDGDRVVIKGQSKSLDEVYSYKGSTLIIDGQPVKVTAHVFMFTDKTYMVRLADGDIPEGATPDSFGELTLGHYDRKLLVRAANISQFDDAMMCFTAGTMIDTPDGPRAVEALVAGDLVETLDAGPQPVRWAGQRTVSGQGKMAPISFAVGAIDNDTPLQLSPQHRVLIRGSRAEIMFGEAEVLCAAKHLVNDETIRQTPCEAVTYVHIMFDSHQIVRSNGAWTESFHPGPLGAEVLSEQWDEIVSIFPELAEGSQNYSKTARPCLKAWEARALMA